MAVKAPTLLKNHRGRERPSFECIALLLQGGGALGAYQAGVYQALNEAAIEPDWVAGISIGAIAVELTSAATGGEITVASFWPAFLVVGLLTIASAPAFMRLTGDAGHEMSGHRRYAPDAVTTMRER